MIFGDRKERLRSKIELLEAQIKLYHERQKFWALKAYDLDPMMEPLRWGRFQNEANWQGVRKMKAQQKMKVLLDELHALEKKACVPA